LAKEEGGDAAGLRRLMDALPDAESRNIRATVIDRMGRPTPGQETDSVFSIGKFLTDYNIMSAKAKSLLFQGESKRTLDDLAAIAAADKKAGKYLNTSNTGRALTTSGTGILAFFNLPLAIASAGGQLSMGALLASPKFATWLAKAPKNPAAFPQYTKKLSAIAASEPIIANDIANVQRFLADQFAKSPGKLAAEDSNDSGREPPPE
jgi:hypothetical protein